MRLSCTHHPQAIYACHGRDPPVTATNLPNFASSKLENTTNDDLDNSTDPAGSDMVLPASDNVGRENDIEPSTMHNNTKESGFKEVRPSTESNVWGFHETSNYDENARQEDGTSLAGSDSYSSTIIGTGSTASQGRIQASIVDTMK